MDVFGQVEPFIASHKSKILVGIGNADQAVTDQGIVKLAGIIHLLLPFPVRLAIKKDSLANVLIANRERVRALLV